jgi:ubiquitin thioesterase protein OTUB1
MFQPQPTPYSPFSSYGVAPPIADFPPFQAASGLVVDSGGPTVFRDTIFSPVATNPNAARGLSFSTHQNSSAHPYKMANNDLEQQEALARDFQPALEVG